MDLAPRQAVLGAEPAGKALAVAEAPVDDQSGNRDQSIVHLHGSRHLRERITQGDSQVSRRSPTTWSQATPRRSRIRSSGRSYPSHRPPDGPRDPLRPTDPRRRHRQPVGTRRLRTNHNGPHDADHVAVDPRSGHSGTDSVPSTHRVRP